jgi:hypothetical protein
MSVSVTSDTSHVRFPDDFNLADYWLFDRL